MIIYINGYWNRITGFLGLTPDTPEESYWNYFSPFFISSSRKFMRVKPNEPNYFVDGSSLFGIDQYASDRYAFGVTHAQEHYDDLISGLRKGDSFKFISHSEGGAFTAGMANYLISKGQIVERILYLSPREADDFDHPAGAFGIQVHFNNDPVCISRRLKGVDVYVNLLKLDSKKASLRSAHGGTVKVSTIRKVKRLLDKLPHDIHKILETGQWTITETEEGFNIEREDEQKTEMK